MSGRDPAEALRNHIAPLRTALGCIARARLVIDERKRFELDRPYTLTFRGVDEAALGGVVPLRLDVRQEIRVVRPDSGELAGLLGVDLVRYVYRFTAADGKEIVAFHWTPSASGHNAVTFPHLHVGPAIVAGQTALRPRDLHKAHIPTGMVSLAAVVRLAIAEFGVAPLRADWERVLRAVEGGRTEG